MIRRTILGVVAVLAALVAGTASAGGWAVVALDDLPTEVRAGETLDLGFTVRQHGVTPVDVHTWEGDFPTLLASNAATGETLSATARKDGAVGHYRVSVTFPSAGAWEWQIVPAPFAGTRFEPLTVGTAASLRVAEARPWLLAGVAALLVAAAALALRSRRPIGGRVAAGPTA